MAIPFLKEFFTSGVGFRLGSETGPRILSGTGTPEGVVTAPVGSMYSRVDGGTDTAIYRKETGGGNTGWVADAAGGGGLPGAHEIMPVPAGGFRNAVVNATALTTVAGALNRLDFMPFIPVKSFTCNELAVEVTTLLAASSLRIGIYSDNNGAPNAKLAETTVALLSATVGVKTSVINLAMTAGTVYWLAVLTSGTQALRAIPVAGLLPLSAPVSGTAVPTLRRATFVFAALPATAPATTATSAIAPGLE